jgi:hypothetical protein
MGQKWRDEEEIRRKNRLINSRGRDDGDDDGGTLPDTKSQHHLPYVGHIRHVGQQVNDALTSLSHTLNYVSSKDSDVPTDQRQVSDSPSSDNVEVTEDGPVLLKNMPHSAGHTNGNHFIASMASVSAGNGDDDEGDDDDDDLMALDPKPSRLVEFILHKLWRTIDKMKKDDDEEKSKDDFVRVVQNRGILSGNAPKLSTEVVEALMVITGDHERAQDSKLIEEMVRVATSPDGLLDEEAFVNALTSDIKDWDVGVEDRESSYVFDVFHEESIKHFCRRHCHTEDSSHGNRTRRRSKLVRDYQNDDHGGSMVFSGENGAKIDARDVTSACATTMKIFHRDNSDLVAAAPRAGNDSKFDIENDSPKSDNDIIEVHVSWSGRVIDFVIDSFASFTVVILIWTVFLCAAGSYGAL